MVHYLWVQELVAARRVIVSKVSGKLNPADMLTKHLAHADLLKCTRIAGQKVVEGRSDLAPNI